MDATEMQHDYRQILKTVLQDWMGAGSDILDPAMLGEYDVIPSLIDEDQVVDPSCYINPAPLPIELSYFEARLNRDKEVELEWSTTTERNTHYFEIERMQEGQETKIIGAIDAQGNSSIEQFYELLDKNPLSGISYYRLRAIDHDGQEEISEWKAN